MYRGALLGCYRVAESRWLALPSTVYHTYGHVSRTHWFNSTVVSHPPIAHIHGSSSLYLSKTDQDGADKGRIQYPFASCTGHFVDCIGDISPAVLEKEIQALRTKQ